MLMRESRWAGFLVPASSSKTGHYLTNRFSTTHQFYTPQQLSAISSTTIMATIISDHSAQSLHKQRVQTVKGSCDLWYLPPWNRESLLVPLTMELGRAGPPFWPVKKNQFEVYFPNFDIASEFALELH